MNNIEQIQNKDILPEDEKDLNLDKDLDKEIDENKEREKGEKNPENKGGQNVPKNNIGDPGKGKGLDKFGNFAKRTKVYEEGGDSYKGIDYDAYAKREKAVTDDQKRDIEDWVKTVKQSSVELAETKGKGELEIKEETQKEKTPVPDDSIARNTPEEGDQEYLPLKELDLAYNENLAALDKEDEYNKQETVEQLNTFAA